MTTTTCPKPTCRKVTTLAQYHDHRHDHFEPGTPVVLLKNQRICRFVEGEFTIVREVEAGTRGTISGRPSNAGFNGLLYTVMLDDGDRVHSVFAIDIDEQS